MSRLIRIGTRESQLAVWQADLVKSHLSHYGFEAELVYIKSEGDIDLKTPLYEMGVQGIFTKSLDIALLDRRIDIAVHSMKDVPVQLANGIVQAAVLKRDSHKDIFVYKKVEDNTPAWVNERELLLPPAFTIATSSTRRKAQWLNRYPEHRVENLRGNVNSRLRKLDESDWHGAIFAAAGLERINIRPINSIDLDWMLPAPAQGAIMVVCRREDEFNLHACANFNDAVSALCTKIERDFLKALLGGCSAPIGAIAKTDMENIIFKGNLLSADGGRKTEVEKTVPLSSADSVGKEAAREILETGGRRIMDDIRMIPLN